MSKYHFASARRSQRASRSIQGGGGRCSDANRAGQQLWRMLAGGAGPFVHVRQLAASGRMNGPQNAVPVEPEGPDSLTDSRCSVGVLEPRPRTQDCCRLRGRVSGAT